MMSFDWLKIYNINMKNQRKQDWYADNYNMFRLKRRVIASLRKHYCLYRHPSDVENNKLDICSKFYENKTKTKIFKAFNYASMCIFKAKRLSIESAERFHKSKQFSLIIKFLKFSADTLSINDQAVYNEVKRKHELQLKIMAFSSLLWKKNISAENKRKVNNFKLIKENSLLSQWFKIWSEQYQKINRLKIASKQIITNCRNNQTRRWFKEFRKLFRHQRMIKKMYFKKWINIWRNEKKESLQLSIFRTKVENFYKKRTKWTLSNVFSGIRIHWLSSRSKKYFKEQESLRRWLKEDLEEKSKLKRRINELILECKDKQMKLSELEASGSIKEQSSMFLEKRYQEEFNSLATVNEENK